MSVLDSLVNFWLELDSVFKFVYAIIPLGFVTILFTMIRDVKNMWFQQQIVQRSLEHTMDSIEADLAEDALSIQRHALRAEQAQYDVGVMMGKYKQKNWFMDMLEREKKAKELNNVVDFKKKDD
ncbi:hypothetical protein [Pseudoalteromonas sp. MMG024]|uniref:hypothetical protein n=1 Tax=Pseudoalteromonas sp. MMG024 TaxID=2909980 RepID=UPI001F243297|nr:hypothetical protein [Pseudoalteromonas sp. MMG024]MCF6459100.1 hypothetical protein [Pseudoalteromonas sp. MMG024]